MVLAGGRRPRSLAGQHRLLLAKALHLPISAFRLLLLRLLVVLLLALVALGMLAGPLGRLTHSGHFERPGPLPVADLLHWLDLLAPAAVPTLAFVALFATLIQQLFAGALLELCQQRSADAPGPLRLVGDQGFRFLPVMLRITALAWLAIGLGLWAISWLFELVSSRADDWAWSASAVLVYLPVGQSVLSLAWVGIVGVWAWWMRVISVADQRRCVRQTAWLAAQALRRFLGLGGLLVFCLGLCALLSGSALLIVWRQIGPRGHQIALIVTAWILWLFVEGYLWQARGRLLCLLYRQRRCDSLRDADDRGFGWWQRLLRLFRRA
ncbi:MAG: hypothetical protein H6707_03325 [Deltaproteobacteria bacterium]|nr:hypothetical protein [Deltaproteobacteria bacterium]